MGEMSLTNISFQVLEIDFIPIIWTSTLFEPYRENDLDMSFDFDLSIENYSISRPTKFIQQHFTEF